MEKKGKRRQHASEGMRSSVGTDALLPKDVLDWFRTSLLDGKAWPYTLLEAIGLWPLAEEEIDGIRYQYLLLGEAFDWVMLAERLLSTVDGLILAEEKENLLFQSRLPQDLPESVFRSLLGPEKYRAHLNYFYGVVVEEALLLAVEEELRKERMSQGLPENDAFVEVAHRRIYGDIRETLLEIFRREMHRPESFSMSLTELKEFTYWLFKRRVRLADSARIASDTKKGLECLFRLPGGPRF